MMIEREDLGLSLSLSAFPHHPNNNNNSTLQLNLMPSLVPTASSSPHSGFNPQKPSWNDALASSDRNSDTCRNAARSFLLGIDVNRLPSTGDCEDVSSPNSTVSSVSGKRSEREANGEDLDLERDGSQGMSDEEGGETSRKKLKLSKDQSTILEESFKEHNTLNPVSSERVAAGCLELSTAEGRRKGRKAWNWVIGFDCFGFGTVRCD